ncbi:MAG TPA: glycoside hydrolase family 32 protein [Euzebyales bacterium]|nr:glycoside hydrolase family 32 protein [Euzebyales bacterium]
MEHRPLLHYEPPSGWLNDPNGLVFHDGEWHLCYQHHPHSLDWGPMHWGHAVSTDLMAWRDLPIALYPDDNGTVYSGCAVIDRRGTAGFGPGAMVAIYTQFTPATQVQSIAGSTDGGRTWQAHPGNPVLRQPDGVVDFRDPKVSWFGEPDDGHWSMVLAAGAGARFYASRDLVTWEPTGAFVPAQDRPHGVWETPDLFAPPVDGPPHERWVLTVGVLEHGPAGGSGTRYWTGGFDGATFTPDGVARWADHGADFYAAQSWSDVADGRRIWIAWMSNWMYAAQVPATAARGQLTLPRQVRLAADGAGGWVLAQRPVDELSRHLGESRALDATAVPLRTGAARVRLRSHADGGGRSVVTVTARDAHAQLIHDAAAGTVTLDRTGAAGIGQGFAGVHTAAVTSGDVVDLDVVIDRSSIEVFADDGRACLTDLVVGLAGDGPVEVGVAGDAVVDAELSHAEPADAG